MAKFWSINLNDWGSHISSNYAHWGSGPKGSTKVSLKVGRRWVTGAGGPVGRSHCFMTCFMFRDTVMDPHCGSLQFLSQVNFLKACMLQKAVHGGKLKLYLQCLKLISTKWEFSRIASLSLTVSVSTHRAEVWFSNMILGGTRITSCVWETCRYPAVHPGVLTREIWVGAQKLLCLTGGLGDSDAGRQEPWFKTSCH